jgi:hypothetical protein
MALEFAGRPNTVSNSFFHLNLRQHNIVSWQHNVHSPFGVHNSSLDTDYVQLFVTYHMEGNFRGDLFSWFSWFRKNNALIYIVHTRNHENLAP